MAVPTTFPEGLTRSRCEAEIAQINDELTKIKRTLLDKYGTWPEAKGHKDEMKEYSRLQRERLAWRKNLELCKF